MDSPKMRPSGAKSPTVYLLGGSPSKEDDRGDNHWLDLAGETIYEKFGKAYFESHVRSNYIVQCYGEHSVVEIECCRNRIISDIEESKPVIVVGIGDEVFQWATGISGTVMNHRGSVITAKFGSHVCWFVPIMYPNFVHKKKKFGKSEYELALEHDIRLVKDLISDGVPPPVHYSSGFDSGIELITGNGPNDLQRLERALADMASLPDVGIDYETNGLRPYFLKDPHIWTAAIGTFDRVIAFPVDHPEGWGTEQRRKQVMGLLGEFLLSSGTKYAHNLAMELEWSEFFFGAKVLRQTEWGDTMAMAHTFDERPGTKSLDVQTRIHYGFFLKAQSRVDPIRLLEYPLKEALRYNAMDSKWTHRLAKDRLEILDQHPVYMREYQRKVRLAPTLVLTETKGLPVDFEYAKILEAKLSDSASSLEAKIRRCPEVKTFSSRFGSFSPTNPDHVLKLMRDICQRSEVRIEDKRTGAVRMSTDEETLSKIPARDVPSAPLILEHRAVSKLSGTYVSPVMSRKIVCPDNKIRAKYSSMVAATGRLACEDPNIQNWPKRKNKEIRGIIAHDLMLACDYGQIEFRVVGMASEDNNLVKYCWTGYDVHKYWAERMAKEWPRIKDYIVETFKVDWDEKGLKTLRQEAKNGWVFPQLFGSSVRSCAEQLHLPEDVAEDLAAEFWDEFSGVKKWQDRLLKNYERDLYVETLGGRRRRGAMTKNEIINMPIQGTASDIVTEAMSALSELSFELERDEIHPSINIHDDLTFLINPNNLDSNLEIISREMCRHRFNYINVPLVVEASTGRRWHELEEIKVFRSSEIFNLENPYV